MVEHWHICSACGEFAPHTNHSARTCLNCLAIGVKYCAVCGRVLSLEAFAKHGNKYAAECLECHRGRNCAQYQANRRKAEAIRRQDPAYREQKNARNRLHYAVSSAATASPLYWAAKNHARRASLRGHFTPADFEKALEYFGHTCAYCGASGPLTMDHIIPVSKFGANKRYNIIPACAHCNSSKNNSDILEWYQKQPFYTVERLLKIHSWFKDEQEQGGSQ